ncbi:E3 ubiquitin-protein ligase RAD18 isoform 2-T2 [Polymixia lowei]
MALQNEVDLPPSLTCLKTFDTLLRCPICFEFLSIAMMTKCSHNFCSLCIRKFLSYKLQCPVCNSQTTEQDLRNNRLLDDLVINIKTTSQQLSKANFDSPPLSPKMPASAVKCKTPRARGPTRDGSILSHFFQKGPKTSPAKEARRVGPAQCVSRGEMESTRTHTTNAADLHLPIPLPPLVVKEEPVEVEAASAQYLMSVKVEEMDISSPVPQPSQAGSPASLEDIKPVIKVECPVCSVGISQPFINKHLDTCLTRGEKKESLRSSVVSRRQPMGKLVYNLLSVSELKRKLKGCHLSVQGSRDQLVKRHKEFVHIYNAQCDSLNPKSAEDIAKEVEANEKTRNQLQGNARPVLVFSKNQSDKEIDELHANYRKQHSSEFSRLIAQVRGHLETTRQTRIKEEVNKEGEEAPESHAAGRAAEPKDRTDSKERLSVMLEETDADGQASAGETSGSVSPSYSDVSISRDLEKTSVRKRPSSSREEDMSPPLILGKRRRKT